MKWQAALARAARRDLPGSPFHNVCLKFKDCFLHLAVEQLTCFPSLYITSALPFERVQKFRWVWWLGFCMITDFVNICSTFSLCSQFMWDLIFCWGKTVNKQTFRPWEVLWGKWNRLHDSDRGWYFRSLKEKFELRLADKKESAGLSLGLEEREKQAERTWVDLR